MRILSSSLFVRSAVAMAGSGALVLGMVTAAAPPASASSLACGTTITSSTTLTANVNCTGDKTDDAIIVGAAGITVNLNGHKILGPGAAADTDGIADYPSDSDGASYNDVTVENGTISNFSTDVDIEGSSGSDLTGVTVDNVTTTNNSPAEGYAVYGGYLEGASIHGMSMNDPEYGVELYESESSSVSDNEVVRPYDGFYDDEGTSDTWTHNSVSAATYDGFDLDGTTDATVELNTVTGTTSASGVYDGESTGVAISKNALNHLYDGLQEYDSSGMVNNNNGSGDTWGIYSEGADGMTYLQNRFDNGQYGIETDFPTSETLQGNTTNHNSEAGVFIYTNEETDPYTAPEVKNNTADNNRYGLYSQISTTGNGNDAVHNTVVNCYKVYCGAGGPRAGSVAPPIHRTPQAIQGPTGREAKF